MATPEGKKGKKKKEVLKPIHVKRGTKKKFKCLWKMYNALLKGNDEEDITFDEVMSDLIMRGEKHIKYLENKLRGDR